MILRVGPGARCSRRTHHAGYRLQPRSGRRRARRTVPARPGTAQQSISLSAPWVPASSVTGGGALPPRGGSGGPSSAGWSRRRHRAAPVLKPRQAGQCSVDRGGGSPCGGARPGRGPKPSAPAPPPPTISRNALAASLNGRGGTPPTGPAPCPTPAPLSS